MSEESPTAGVRDRRLREVLFALGCLVALATAALLLPLLGVAPVSHAGGDGGENGAGDGGGVGDGLGASDSSPLAGGAIGAGDETSAGHDENPFQNGSAEIQFTVESDRPAYWRIDAYDQYTGHSWERTDDERSYPGELQPEGPVTDTLTQTVTLNAPAGALPGAWQPSRVDVQDETALTVSSQGGIHTDEYLPAGTTYTIESYQHTPSPDALRADETTSDEEIATRYTQLPAETPDRVHDLATEITADAETRYDRADAVERWIKANKEYSLEAEHDTDGRPVDEFLFEMDAGYCQYSASSMVVLLRSEEIPARYVTGYSPGTVAEDGSYEVRSTNAHAWVEVYFADHGWVQFDPTPADDRMDGEQDDLDEAGVDDELADAPSVTDDRHDESDDDRPGDDDDAEGGQEGDEPENTDDTDDHESDTPDEPEDADQDDDDSTEEDADQDDDDSTEEDPEQEADSSEDEDADTSSYEVTLTPDEPIPGAEATATVTRTDTGHDSTPVEGAEVRFNDDPIGETNESGAVTGEVPFADSVAVSVDVPAEDEPIDRQASVPVFASGVGTGPVTSATGSETTARTETTAENETTAGDGTRQTFSTVSDMTIDTDASMLVAGDETTARVTIQGTPVSGATVQIDNEALGETDEDGQLTMSLPDEPATDIDLSAQRGELTAERTVSIDPLAIDVDHADGIPLPTRETTLTVRAGNETLSDIEIDRDGSAIGTTDDNGTVTTELPIERAVTYSVAYGEATAEQSVDRILLTAAGVIGAGIAAIAALGILARRFGLTPRRLVLVARAAVVRAIDLVVLLTGRVDVVFGRLLDRLRGGWAAVRALPGDLYARWQAWRPDSFVGAIRATIRAGIAGCKAWLLARYPWRETTETATGGAGQETGATSQLRQTIRAAWGAFVRMVRPRGYRTKTPGEIARKAVSLGFPKRSVDTLTDAFRKTEYGGGGSDEQAEEATAALERLQDASETPGETDR